MEFLFGFGSFFFPFGLLLLGAVVLAVFAIVGRRPALDPAGRRPMAIYLLAVMFVTLITSAGSLAQMGSTLAREAFGAEPIWSVTVGTSFANYRPLADQELAAYSLGVSQALSEILRSALAGILAIGIFEFHRRRFRELLRRETTNG
jgi:hypothetical protein